MAPRIIKLIKLYSKPWSFSCADINLRKLRRFGEEGGGGGGGVGAAPYEIIGPRKTESNSTLSLSRTQLKSCALLHCVESGGGRHPCGLFWSCCGFWFGGAVALRMLKPHRSAQFYLFLPTPPVY